MKQPQRIALLNKKFLLSLLASLLLNILLGIMMWITRKSRRSSLLSPDKTALDDSLLTATLNSLDRSLRPDSATLEQEHMAVTPARPFGYEDVAKKARLTHLVIPFHRRQEEEAKRNIDMWRQFPPCPAEQLIDSPDPHFYRRAHGNYPLGRNVSLVLFLNCERDSELETRLRASFDVLPLSVRQCFSRMDIRYAKLEENQDTYLFGSRIMFEKMLNGHIGLSEPSYVLYMEPDCLPVRRHWLMLIDAQTRFPAASFWTKGSPFRGDIGVLRNPSFRNQIHINGNAIYNLGDPGFRHFYFDRVRPFIYNLQLGQAYDTDIFEYILNPKHFETVRKIVHLFQYTDVIQNHWHSNYTISKLRELSPFAVLVHGGRQVK